MKFSAVFVAIAAALSMTVMAAPILPTPGNSVAPIERAAPEAIPEVETVEETNHGKH